MGMGFAPTWLRQVSPHPASQNHFNHWFDQAYAISCCSLILCDPVYVWRSQKHATPSRVLPYQISSLQVKPFGLKGIKISGTLVPRPWEWGCREKGYPILPSLHLCHGKFSHFGFFILQFFSSRPATGAHPLPAAQVKPFERSYGDLLKNLPPHARHAFQGHSKSFEPTRIDRLPMTSYQCSIVTMGLGDTAVFATFFQPPCMIAPLRRFPSNCVIAMRPKKN